MLLNDVQDIDMECGVGGWVSTFIRENEPGYQTIGSTTVDITKSGICKAKK